MIRNISIIIFLLSICACAPSTPLFVASPSSTNTDMSINECKEAKFCTVRGTVFVVENDGIAMGEIRKSDGKCVTLSLSQNDIKYLRKSGPIETIIYGKIYRGHHDQESIILKIEGRRVGYPRCGEFYMFVSGAS